MFGGLWKRLFLAMSRSRRLRALSVRNPILRRASERFVAGDRIDDALKVMESLGADGLKGIADYLGEDVSSAEKAGEAVSEYARALSALPGDAVLAVKLTQLGLSMDRDLCTENLDMVLDAAASCRSFVEIDMEGSRHTQATLDIFRKLRGRYHVLGVTVQAYLKRSGEDLKELRDFARSIDSVIKVRLVKGAYDEPGDIAFTRKREIRESFERLSSYLFENPEFFPAIATHDERLIGHAKRLGGNRSGGFEFQMLLGVRRDLQRSLAREGYPVRVYVPYGDFWFPYLMRRIGERPANGLFALRQLI
jgi:proline dehydrogenase